jgi:glycosyltransferase involved in cell wall biosynthesis
LNVLHLTSGRGPTGPAAAAMGDVRSLLAAGHKAYLAVRDGSALPAACEAAGIPYVAGLKMGRGARQLLHLPRDVRRLRSLIREYAIDVVHVHRTGDQLLAAAALGRTLSAVLVRTWHRDPGGIARILLRRLCAQTDGCVCVSREHVESLRAAGAEHAVFVHVAVDTEVFRPPGAGTEKKTGPVRVVHVGRWKRDRDGHDRGQRAALDVFAALPQTLPWEGFLVGRGEDAEALRQEAYERRKLPRERVQLVNFAEYSPRRFAGLLATFNLGLVFTTGSDGTSRAGAELLACGVPLLAADVPGVRELAEDSACAQRHAAGNPRGWARAIEQLASDRAALDAMQRQARARAEACHTPAARGRSLAEFYRAL